MDTQQTETVDDNTFAKEALVCEIGVKLEKAREDKGLSKDQVLKELKFNASFLDALESGQWSEMPGEVYALGFLRQYAELLSLDLSTDIERIKTNTYELTTPLTYPDAPISPNRTWAMVAALLFILGMIISNLFNREETVSSNVMSPANPPAEIEATTQDNTATVDVHMTTTNSQDHMIVADEKADTNTLLLSKESGSKKPLDAPKVDSTLKAFTFIAVTDDVWLQVYEQREGEEPTLKREALLRVGQSFSLDSTEQLLLTSGKPTALKVLRDGEVVYDVGTLGEEDKVLKLFQL